MKIYVCTSRDHNLPLKGAFKTKEAAFMNFAQVMGNPLGQLEMSTDLQPSDFDKEAPFYPIDLEGEVVGAVHELEVS